MPWGEEGRNLDLADTDNPQSPAQRLAALWAQLQDMFEAQYQQEQTRQRDNEYGRNFNFNAGGAPSGTPGAQGFGNGTVFGNGTTIGANGEVLAGGGPVGLWNKAKDWGKNFLLDTGKDWLKSWVYSTIAGNPEYDKNQQALSDIGLQMAQRNMGVEDDVLARTQGTQWGQNRTADELLGLMGVLPWEEDYTDRQRARAGAMSDVNWEEHGMIEALNRFLANSQGRNYVSAVGQNAGQRELTAQNHYSGLSDMTRNTITADDERLRRMVMDMIAGYHKNA